jgi:hypothetical protein
MSSLQDKTMSGAAGEGLLMLEHENTTKMTIFQGHKAGNVQVT